MAGNDFAGIAVLVALALAFLISLYFDIRANRRPRHASRPGSARPGEH